MVSASVALKLTMLVEWAFCIGMCFFPSKMMEGYKADTFEGAGAAFFQFGMGIMGIQMMYSACLSTSSAKAWISEKEQSMACFCKMAIFGAFVFLDGRYLLGLSGYPLPEAIPRMSFLGNLVFFAAVAALNFVGWQASGSATPDFGAFLPKGPAKLPLLVGLANLVFFAIGCGFATEQFLEMYAPGALASVPGSPKVTPMVYLVLGNAGKLMLFNILSTLAIASVGNETTTYRLLRIGCFINLFYIGSVSREHIVFSSHGWAAPMYTISFIQCFGVTFFMCNRFGSIQVTLPKDKAN